MSRHAHSEQNRVWAASWAASVGVMFTVEQIASASWSLTDDQQSFSKPDRCRLQVFSSLAVVSFIACVQHGIVTMRAETPLYCSDAYCRCGIQRGGNYHYWSCLCSICPVLLARQDRTSFPERTCLAPVAYLHGAIIVFEMLNPPRDCG